jgi:hypothetical protein
MKRRLLTRGVVFMLALVASAERGIAQDIVAGWEGDNTRGYVFIAPTASVDLGSSQAILLRGTGSFLYYGSQADGPTDVTAPGASAAVGYRVSGSRVNASVLAGFEERRIQRRLSGGRAYDWEGGPSLSGELFVSASSLTQVSALANYGQANRYSWMRVGVKRQLSNTTFTGKRAVSVGVELTGQGNRDVTQYQLGGVFELGWLSARSSLQIRTGYAKSIFTDASTEARPYLGIGIYRHL